MATTDIQRTFGTPTNAKIYTFSMWIKKCDSSGVINWISSAPGQFGLNFRTTNDIDWHEYTGGYKYRILTNRLFRDPAAWYHLCFTFDSTESVAGDRCKIYVNGVEETSFSTETQPTLNYDSVMNSAVLHAIGSQEGEGYANYGKGILLSHVHFVDGTAYPASTFGETDSDTGEWKIKTSVSVTYGDNGFFIFKDNASVTDQSGEGNNWTVSNGTLTPTEDCPDDIFATLNPLTNDAGGAKTYSFGNTKVAETANSWTSAHSTLACAAGKYYFEAKVTYTSGTEAYIGACSQQGILDKVNATHYLGQTVDSVGFYTGDGNYYKGAGAVSYGSAVTSGQVVGCALDLTNNFIYFSINGTWQNSGVPTSGASGTGGISLPSGMTGGEFMCLSVSPNESYLECNYGNGYFGTTVISSEGTNASNIGKFEYDVPTGFTALSAKGLNS